MTTSILCERYEYCVVKLSKSNKGSDTAEVDISGSGYHFSSQLCIVEKCLPEPEKLTLAISDNASGSCTIKFM